ncbi:DNA-processing protein DprA [Variovorax sp. J22P168]|uniref:DNA-processing protein DprA n=1 Tax=Variovorax jilinensis TaxID=3053513 RepID=UPI00257836D4|nr:DNA-processing protein DprA [Variovorax sp. J22P168]MDM0014093.1 DNA-processing protein DprA [Variovorax sp. J22P168]
MERDELASWLRLSLTRGIGDALARRLLSAFGLPDDIFRQSTPALRQIATSAQAKALQDEPPGFADQLARTSQWLAGHESHGGTRRILTLGDAGYPAALLETADPPLMLYVLGSPALDLGATAQALAIVGSRNPTAQGLQNARAFARALAEAGIPIVSGLALGIDGAAHEGALEGAAADALATVAVIGTGLDRVYPARHRELAHRIAERGLIVSEYPLGTPPLAQNFPQRNRIISGLSHGTLVIEAALRSGSLITARLAAEQGREVFAIPGSIHAPQSRGCHALIREGAKLVETVDDVLEELQVVRTPPSTSASETAPDTASESQLLQAIGFDPVSIDALCARTGIAAALLQARLLELELDGSVARLPGGLFQRIGLA